MTLYEMRQEISKARQVLENADRTANSLAYILEGRLKQVNGSTLSNIKKELKNFNAHTLIWK